MDIRVDDAPLPPSEVVAASVPRASDGPAAAVLGGISFAHMLNDMIQSLILAIYPLLKEGFHLSFTQIGLITLTYQITASLLQPLVGMVTDRRPMPYSLPVGMGFTLLGLLLLSVAPSFALLLLAAALVGTGSAIFHPESSRVARLASGGRHGLAQSVFQVGGNAGASLGPLLAAWIIVPHGRGSVAWFSLAALLAIAVLLRISGWYRAAHSPSASSAGYVQASRALPTPVAYAGSRPPMTDVSLIECEASILSWQTTSAPSRTAMCVVSFSAAPSRAR